MSTIELDEVRALLDKVLPDPAGFAQRLLLQALERWGQPTAGGAGTFFADSFRAPPSFTTATAEDVTDEHVTDEDAADALPPVDTNVLLAAALGACECWGMLPSCELCDGDGVAGWTEPDAELFDEFVRPAVVAMTRSCTAAGDSGGRPNPQGDDR
jgi:hypothetical protein